MPYKYQIIFFIKLTRSSQNILIKLKFLIYYYWFYFSVYFWFQYVANAVTYPFNVVTACTAINNCGFVDIFLIYLKLLHFFLLFITIFSLQIGSWYASRYASIWKLVRMYETFIQVRSFEPWLNDLVQACTIYTIKTFEIDIIKMSSQGDHYVLLFIHTIWKIKISSYFNKYF